MQKKKRIVLLVIAAILLVVLCVSCVQIIKIYREYAEESKQHQELLIFKPTEPTPLPPGETEPEYIPQPGEPEPVFVNQSVIDMQERYHDTIGWLTIDGTKIDYPFVQAADNQKYLRRDLELNYLSSGTVFMDYRNSPDFTDFSTILYGHQMYSDSMFGTLKWFRKDEFFLENRTGRIYLPNETLELEIVALLVVSADDEGIYALEANTDEEKQSFITHIYEKAEQLHEDVELTLQDRFVLLSTCAYDFDGARLVLVTRIANVYS